MIEDRDHTRDSGPARLTRGWDAGLIRRLEGALATPWPDLVGVDLGESSIKVVRVARRGMHVGRVEVARVPIPGTAAKPSERRDAVRRALAEIVATMGLRGKPAAAAVFGNEVIVRRLTLPDLKRADVLAALALECRKHVNFPIEESEIRYEVVGRSEKQNARELQLLVCVAHRRRVSEAREAILDAGLKPVAITIGAVALRALLRASGPPPRDEVIAYLDMGAGSTHIMVLKGEEIRFSREFGMGGAALTEALRSIVVPGHGNVELSLEEAESLKRAHGIPMGAEESATAGRIPLAAASVMLRPTLERLVREVWNTFDYCNEQFLGEAVSRVVLLGEGARVKNLPEYLTGVLKIPVTRADLWSRVGVAPVGRGGSKDGDPSDLGLGLALLERGALNFLVPARAGIPYRVAEAVPRRIAAAVAVMLLLSVSLPVHVTVLQERERIGSLRRTLADLEPRAEALRRFRAAREEETRLNDLLAHLSGGQVLWSYVLRDLSHRVGPDVRLTGLEVASPPTSSSGATAAASPGPRRTILLTGLLRTQGRRTEDVLAELMTSLSRSPALDQVRLEGCRAVTPALSSFSLTADLVE